MHKSSYPIFSTDAAAARIRRTHVNSVRKVHRAKAILACVLFLTSPALVTSTTEIAYVLDSFETNITYVSHKFNGVGSLDLSTTTDDGSALFGSGALQVEYTIESSEVWGGFVNFERVTKHDTISHNCHGAEYVSFWYNNIVPQSLQGSVQFRLILLDSSDCVEDCSSTTNNENYYSFHAILDGNPGWNEVRIKLQGDDQSSSPFYRTGWAGTVGNNVLDLENIKGWVMELNIHGEHPIGSQSSGTILIDHLACVGGSSLIGASMWDPQPGYDGTEELTSWIKWDTHGLLTSYETREGAIKLNYMLEDNVSSAYAELQHVAPVEGYYNLSHASGVSFNYDIGDVGDAILHVRLAMITDICTYRETCNTTERDRYDYYYSLHNRLFNSSDTLASLKFPFPTGGKGTWIGRNAISDLDPSHIKGLRFELNIGREDRDDGHATGIVAFEDLVAFSEDYEELVSNETNTGLEAEEAEPLAIVEFDLFFTSDAANTTYETIANFVSEKCFEVCEQDPTCLFGYYDLNNCYLTNEVNPGDIHLARTEYAQNVHSAFWSNSATKRGDFCDKCICSKETRTIDCRDQDLLTIPKTFSESWWPQILDLRNNPKLALLGTGSLADIAASLEQIYLPKNMKHLSYGGLSGLSHLSSIIFEEDEAKETTGGVSVASANTAIIGWGESDFYGDVCCDRGQRLNLLTPSDGMTFCSLMVDKPGLDSVYRPFIQFFHAAHLNLLRPGADYLGDIATRNVENCAEACTLYDDCNYWEYDSRKAQSEHTCTLLRNKGLRTIERCCNPGDFADEEGTLPGIISGIPPRTRHSEDDAKVLFTPVVTTFGGRKGNKVSYEVSLGSTPHRGAVWIEPQFDSSNMTSASSFKLLPRRIALYDSNTTVRVEMIIDQEESSEIRTFVVDHEIISCDRAFTTRSSVSSFSKSMVTFNYVPDENVNLISKTLIYIAIGIVVWGLFISVFFLLWTIRYRDNLVVKMSQPVFLVLIILGSTITSLSLLPTMIQAGYGAKHSVASANTACMAFPWVFNVGFSIMFSALFAKIWRIRKIFYHASKLQRVVVQPRDVYGVMIGFTSVSIVFMTCWQFMDPLQWKREVVRASSEGHTLESRGSCESDSQAWFMITMAVYNTGFLVYALYLCYVTRFLPSDLNESKWVTCCIVSSLQTVLLATPVLVIARSDTNAFFFVRVGVVCLISHGILCFIFVPKVLAVHCRTNQAGITSDPSSWMGVGARRSSDVPSSQNGVSSSAPNGAIREF